METKNKFNVGDKVFLILESRNKWYVAGQFIITERIITLKEDWINTKITTENGVERRVSLVDLFSTEEGAEQECIKQTIIKLEQELKELENGK